jgi:broad specificity phosphatase PhoE
LSERLVYLVRHGETEGESSIRYHGRSDVPLSDLGREQVRRLTPLLRDVDFTALVSSPLVRAWESGSILQAELVRPPASVDVEPGLIEVDFGAIEGLTDAEIAARLPEWHREWKAGRHEGFPHGETLAGFARRVAEAFDRVLRRHAAGNVLVVCHRGVIKWGVVHLLGLSADQSRTIAVDLGSLSVVRLGAVNELVRCNVVP